MEQQKRNCDNCGSPNNRLIPAGVSKKTGKSYNAFYSCQDCKKTSKIDNTAPKGKIATDARFNAIIAKLDEVLSALDAIYMRIDTFIPNPNPNSIVRKKSDDVPF